MIILSSTSSKQPVPPLVKKSDVAKILGISLPTVRNLIESGDLKASSITPSTKPRRLHTRVTRASLLTFYKKRFGHPLNQALANPFESTNS